MKIYALVVMAVLIQSLMDGVLWRLMGFVEMHSEATPLKTNNLLLQ